MELLWGVAIVFAALLGGAVGHLLFVWLPSQWRKWHG